MAYPWEGDFWRFSGDDEGADFWDPANFMMGDDGSEEEAAKTQLEMQQKGLDFMQDQWGYSQAINQPWLAAGGQGLKGMMQGMGLAPDEQGKWGQNQYDVDIPGFNPQAWEQAPQEFEYGGAPGTDLNTRMDEMMNEGFQFGQEMNTGQFQGQDMPRAFQAGAIPISQFESKPWDLSALEKDPGYQFRKQQGTKAIEGAAAARGGRLGGGALKELMEFGSGLASQEADKAYGRYAEDRGFDRGSQQQYIGNLMGDRGQRAGLQAQDYGQAASNRDYFAGQNLEEFNKQFADRNFQLGERGQRLGELTGDRSFKYGEAQNLRAQQLGERAFKYGGAQDYLRNLGAERGSRSNRMAAISGIGQTTASQLGGAAGQAGGNIAGQMGNVGGAGAGYAMAGKQGLSNDMAILGQLFGLFK